MRGLWSPEVEPSVEEQRILNRCKKAKLFVFLRQVRHELFDDAFQRELCRTLPKSESKVGRPPVPPAMLAMVTLLQAALGVSDEDAVEFAEMDRRWQMLLGTLGQEVAPFSQGTLFNFRQRLIAHDLDRRLLERTVEFAKARTTFSAKALRAAFDASPLFGAGRVEPALFTQPAEEPRQRAVARRENSGIRSPNSPVGGRQEESSWVKISAC